MKLRTSFLKAAAAGPAVRARVLGWTAMALTAVLVAAVLAGYFTVRAKFDSIGYIPHADNHHRPKRYNNALNVLLLGSDSRSGHNAVIGGKVGCDCSDTIMVVHISPGRGAVTVLSIPRDTMVPYYACTPSHGTPGQQADLATFERINATLEAGGPECVRETVEQQTGIRIDTIIQLDFTGFQKVINDVGGVKVCVPVTISDPIRTLSDGDEAGSGLHLTAGEHHISGRVALKFWRARYALADGSDLARISRDQYLMAQIVKGVLHKHLLGSPSTLYHVVSDVADALSTDATTSQLVGILLSLRHVSSHSVQFVTAPTIPYPGDPLAELSFAPTATAVFTAISRDRALPSHQHGADGSKQHGRGHSSAGAPPAVRPSRVRLTVLNGTSTHALAAKVAAELSARGYTVVGQPGNAARSDHASSEIDYGTAADRGMATALGKLFPGAALVPTAGVPAGTVQLVLGASFTTLAQPDKPLGSISGSFKASARCRNSAFFGTNLPEPKGKVGCAC